MIEEIIKTLTSANAVAEYAKINGYDEAGINKIVALWNELQKPEVVVETIDNDDISE